MFASVVQDVYGLKLVFEIRLHFDLLFCGLWSSVDRPSQDVLCTLRV